MAARPPETAAGGGLGLWTGWARVSGVGAGWGNGKSEGRMVVVTGRRECAECDRTTSLNTGRTVDLMAHALGHHRDNDLTSLRLRPATLQVPRIR